MTKLTYILIFIVVFAGCSKPIQEVTNTDTSSVAIRLPSSTKKSALRHLKSVKRGQMNAMDITSLDNIDCYAITVSYEGGLGLCTDENSQVVVDEVQQVFGSFPEGSLIELDIISGKQRKISIFGFSSSNPVCPDFTKVSRLEMSNTSSPVFVGETIADIEGEVAQVDITISITGSKKVGKEGCINPPFDWEPEVVGKWDSSTSLWDVGVWAP